MPGVGAVAPRVDYSCRITGELRWQERRGRRLLKGSVQPTSLCLGDVSDYCLGYPSSWLVTAIMRFQVLLELIQLFGAGQLVRRFRLCFRL